MLNVHGSVDQWSNSQATLGVDRSAGEVSEHQQEVAADREDLTVTGIKAAVDAQKDDGVPEESTTSNPVPPPTNHGYPNLEIVQDTSIMHVSSSQPSAMQSSVTPALLSDSSPSPLGATTTLMSSATPRPRDLQSRNRLFNEVSSRCPVMLIA